MKDLILKHFEAMAIDVQELKDMGYSFEYKGLRYLYMPDDEDEHFLRIAVPCIYEVTDDNRTVVLDAVNEANLRIKYSRVGIMYDDTVWAVYEHYLHSTDKLDDLLYNILCVIDVMVLVFRDRINELKYTNNSVKN